MSLEAHFREISIAIIVEENGFKDHLSLNSKGKWVNKIMF